MCIGISGEFRARGTAGGRFDTAAGALSGDDERFARGHGHAVGFKRSCIETIHFHQAIQKTLEEKMRKLSLACFVALFVCAIANSQGMSKEANALTVIRAGSLIDGTSDA